MDNAGQGFEPLWSRDFSIIAMHSVGAKVLGVRWDGKELQDPFAAEYSMFYSFIGNIDIVSVGPDGRVSAGEWRTLWYESQCSATEDVLWLATAGTLWRVNNESTTLILEAVGLRAAAPPLQLGDVVVSFWNTRDDTPKSIRGRIALTTGDGATRWIRESLTQIWSATTEGGAIFVKTDSEIVRLSVQSFEFEARVDTQSGYGPLAVGPGQLFFSDSIDFQSGVTRWSEPTPQGRVGVSGWMSKLVIVCLDATTLELERQWSIEEAANATFLVPLFTHEGLLVATRESLWALTSQESGPVLLGRWKGGELLEPRVHEHRVIIPVDWHYGEYMTLDILDLTDLSWSRLRLPWAWDPPDLDDQPVSLCIVDQVLFVSTGTAIHGLYWLDVVRMAIPVGKLDVSVRLRQGSEGRILEGLPLAGPATEQWATSVDRRLAKQLMHEDEFGAWVKAAEDDRFRIWQNRFECDLLAVEQWEDVLHFQVQETPREFVDLCHRFTEEGFENATPILEVDWPPPSFFRRMWRWKAETEIPFVGRRDATRCARVILQEYALRAMTYRTLRSLRVQLSSAELSVGAWMNVGGLGMEQRDDISPLTRMAEKWGGRLPQVVKDPVGFVGFVRDGVTESLLGRVKRSRLQKYIALAWTHPAVVGNRTAFVSYSSLDLPVVNRIVTALGHRGISVILDRNDLARQEPDSVIEMWIAESMMRATTVIHVLSERVRRSGWVHLESLWHLRLLGVKDQFIPPIFVLLDDSAATGYPVGRVVRKVDLERQWDTAIDVIAARVAADWLLGLQARHEGRDFGYGCAMPIDFTTSDEIY